MRNRILACLFALAGVSAQAQTSRPAARWPASTPEVLGLDPAAIHAFDADIAAGKYGYIDSMLIIRHGKVAFDRSYPHDYDRIYSAEAAAPGPLNAHDRTGPYNYFNPWWHPFYRRGELHSLQSATKTVTSVVIGIATSHKEFPSLDTPVLNFFDASKVANVDDRKRRLTIRHLLTMTAGLEWNEDLPYDDPNNSASVMEAGFDWVGYVINRPMTREPGTEFRYNSGATQLLSHIFTAATGEDIEEYAQEHLFAPLGIVQHFWKRSPTGLVDTEGGLYLRSHDLAKIGWLYLKNGVWAGQALVEREWVKASVTPSSTVSPDGVKYGYKWWLIPYGKGDARLAWAAQGFGGQRVIVFPDYDLVVVFTGWNILPDRPALPGRVTVDRILAAVADRRP
jgi:CubicO group peptidase (beta-lactamase class C family)